MASFGPLKAKSLKLFVVEICPRPIRISHYGLACIEGLQDPISGGVLGFNLTLLLSPCFCSSFFSGLVAGYMPWPIVCIGLTYAIC